MSEKKSFRKFKKREGPPLTKEQTIEKFILRNSQNGYFTKISTIPYKFEVSESKTWDIIGELLSNGLIEATHDEFTGEMKLCETGKTYLNLDLERKRKREKSKAFKKKYKSKKITNALTTKK
ncbi:hypothetical protein [Nitrosopumilus sp.]|uniref:hypothetical protein n=1 Tax=Nitrosopumilus sp. TaxID=2024843 RepID=UPI0029302730|nr:hypothetical protein [Nitrosopumilus sp.]